MVDDGTGTALVGSSASVFTRRWFFLERQPTWTDGEGTQQPLAGFLERYRIAPSSSVVGWTMLEYGETVLEEGDEVAVVGRAHWEPDPNPTASQGHAYRQRAYRLVLQPTRKGRLLVTMPPA